MVLAPPAELPRLVTAHCPVVQIRAGESRTIRLAQALAGLGEGLGLDTVAEGVETEAQVQILAAQGWHYAQGWLFGRPHPLPAMPAQS